MMVEFTPKFKIGDSVLAENGDICVIEQIQSLSVCFDKDGEVEKKGCWYRVRNDNGGHECWAEYDLVPYTKPANPLVWAFTDDEKVILRNLPAEYKWLARDKNGKLFAFISKPVRTNKGNAWIDTFVTLLSMNLYNHLFQSVQWTDDEPCEFRKYI